MMEEKMEGHTAFICDLAGISTLNLGCDTIEGASKGVFRGSEQHLLLDLCVVGGPACGFMGNDRKRTNQYQAAPE